MEKLELGSSGIEIPPLCIGTWAWGDRLFFGKKHERSDLKEVYEKSLDAGINFFDTAEVYGRGKSEKILGDCIAETKENNRPIIATKYAPQIWRLRKKALIRALKKSLQRLCLPKIDLYQLHSSDNMEKWLDAIADAYHEGLIKAVGVSNFYPEEVKKAYEILDNRGIKLASVQMHYSLLYRKHEINGLLDLTKKLDVSFLGYMVLEQGTLTGKYSPANPPRGIWRRLEYRKKTLEKIQPLVSTMRKIGQKYGDKSPAQVAINYVLGKGIIPIIGVRKASHLRSNLEVLDWSLDKQDVQRLDEITAASYQNIVKTSWKS